MSFTHYLTVLTLSPLFSSPCFLATSLIRSDLESFLICNNSSYNVAEGTGTGDLAEVAFLGYAARKKVFKSAVDINNTKLFE